MTAPTEENAMTNDALLEAAIKAYKREYEAVWPGSRPARPECERFVKAILDVTRAQADAPALATMREALRKSREALDYCGLSIWKPGKEREQSALYRDVQAAIQSIDAALSGAVAAPREPSGADASNLMWQALRSFIYETTHLSPQEDDGAHKCRISAKTLADGRAALEAYEWEDIHAAGGIFQEERAALLAKEGQ